MLLVSWVWGFVGTKFIWSDLVISGCWLKFISLFLTFSKTKWFLYRSSEDDFSFFWAFPTLIGWTISFDLNFLVAIGWFWGTWVSWVTTIVGDWVRFLSFWGFAWFLLNFRGYWKKIVLFGGTRWRIMAIWGGFWFSWRLGVRIFFGIEGSLFGWGFGSIDSFITP